MISRVARTGSIGGLLATSLALGGGAAGNLSVTPRVAMRFAGMAGMWLLIQDFAFLKTIS